MDERAQGIILRVYPLTETSLIIRWLTPQFGRIATVAKGARRPKSAFHGKLDLFYLADFMFRRSQRSELHPLREVSLIETHGILRRELAYLQQACYCAALVEQATEIETPIPAIFRLMKGLLNCLNAQPSGPHLIFAFELKLLNELGLKPDLAKSRLTAGAKQIVLTLADSDWDAFRGLKLSTQQAVELRQFLHGYLIFHLGKIPVSRSAALQL